MNRKAQKHPDFDGLSAAESLYNQPQQKTDKDMKPHQEIIHSLPETFTRQTFIQQVAEETAYSYSHAQTLLDNALFQGSIERVGRGEYRKIQSEPEFD